MPTDPKLIDAVERGSVLEIIRRCFMFTSCIDAELAEVNGQIAALHAAAPWQVGAWERLDKKVTRWWDISRDDAAVTSFGAVLNEMEMLAASLAPQEAKPERPPMLLAKYNPVAMFSWWSVLPHSLAMEIKSGGCSKLEYLTVDREQSDEAALAIYDHERAATQTGGSDG